MREHAEKLGAKIVMDSVSSIAKEDDIFNSRPMPASIRQKISFWPREWNTENLRFPGKQNSKEREFPIARLATRAFFKDKIVAVVGGGNSAASAALLLAEYASKVYLDLSRRKTESGSGLSRKKFRKNEKSKLFINTNIKEIKGEKAVEKIILDKNYQRKR